MALESKFTGMAENGPAYPPLKGGRPAKLASHPTVANSVVETTDAKTKLGHYNTSEEIARFQAIFRPEPSPENKPINPHSAELRGTSPMQEMRSPYVRAGQSAYAHPTPKVTSHSSLAHGYPGHSSAPLPGGRFGFLARLSLLQKILISNIVIIMGGAIVGSWLTAQLAEAGKFNLVTFSIIILTAVLFSGAVSFTILKVAFRPFDELQRVLAKIHEGNPRARASLHQITNPDVRQFTVALNQMLTRLEENAHVIQEDQRQLQLMTAQVINAQENERKRIARELHDEASQSLTAMIMGLEAARKAAPGENSALQNQLGGLKELAAATLEELRKLALDLRPTMLDDLGLVPAVRWLSRCATERAGLEVKLALDGFDEHERLAPEMETGLFRITQESLTNITKHAQASQVEISLGPVVAADGTPQVRLVVADNGRGFDRAEARAEAYRGGHLGLFDIEERAALLGGKVKISIGSQSPTGKGTCIEVLLPLGPRSTELPQGISTKAPPYIK